MPNHESNNTVIIGEPAKIRAFIAEAFIHPGHPFPGQEGDVVAANTKGFPLLNFDLIKPQPENIEHGGCNGEHAEGVVCWYEWNREAWGTKWGAYEHDHYELRWLQRSQWADNPGEIYGRIDLRFETAWSQPTPIFEAIEERWGVNVYCITQDEGGFPDVYFPDESAVGEQGVIRKVVTFEFDTDMDAEVAEPATEKVEQ